MSSRDDLLEAWCHRLWNELPRAKHVGLDATQPRDLLAPRVDAASRLVGRLRRRRGEAERSLAQAEGELVEAEPGAGVRMEQAARRLAELNLALGRAEAYAAAIREARVVAVALDCISANPALGRYRVDGVDEAPIADLPRRSNGNLGLGSAFAWDATQADAQERREFAEYTRARLAENPGLDDLLRNGKPSGVEAVYVFAGLTDGEAECAWLEHNGGLHPTAIAELTKRSNVHAVEELLRRAHYKLRQLAQAQASGESWAV